MEKTRYKLFIIIIIIIITIIIIIIVIIVNIPSINIFLFRVARKVLIFREFLRAFDGFNSFVIPDISMRKIYTLWSLGRNVNGCVCACDEGGGGGVGEGGVKRHSSGFCKWG